VLGQKWDQTWCQLQLLLRYFTHVCILVVGLDFYWEAFVLDQTDPGLHGCWFFCRGTAVYDCPAKIMSSSYMMPTSAVGLSQKEWCGATDKYMFLCLILLPDGWLSTERGLFQFAKDALFWPTTCGNKKTTHATRPAWPWPQPACASWQQNQQATHRAEAINST
jgi:hypothetical protein